MAYFIMAEPQPHAVGAEKGGCLRIPHHSEVASKLRNLVKLCRSAVKDWLSRGRLEDNEKSEGAVREVVQLQGILITEALALLTYVYGYKGIQMRAILAYVLLSALPLIGMLLITVLRRSFRDRSRAFNRSTILFARWAIAVSCLMVAVVVAAALGGVLPGQDRVKAVPLPVGSVEVTHFDQDFPDSGVKKGDEKVVVHVPIHPLELGPQNLPDLLKIEAALRLPVANSWRIVNCTGRMLPEGEAPWGTIHRIECRGHQATFVWEKLDTKHLYDFRIILHKYRETPEGVTVTELKDRLRRNPQDAILVLAYLLDRPSQ